MKGRSRNSALISMTAERQSRLDGYQAGTFTSAIVVRFEGLRVPDLHPQARRPTDRDSVQDERMHAIGIPGLGRER